jgi:hypothetical protein
VLSELRTNCARASLEQAKTDLLVAQTRQILVPLIERGRQLAAIGSQMRVVRDVAGEGYSLKIIFGTGHRRGFLQRLLNAIRGD